MRTPPLTGPAPSEDHGLGPIPVLRIRHAPDPVLLTPALPLKIDPIDVQHIEPRQVAPGPYSPRPWSDYLRYGLVNRMIRLMHEHDGVGIAAPQVGLADRVIVIRRQGSRDYDVWVNPVLEPYAPEDSRTWHYERPPQRVVAPEGCLSLPGVVTPVARWDQATVRGYRLCLLGPHLATLQWASSTCTELEARVLQHEVDHLDGILITDPRRT